MFSSSDALVGKLAKELRINKSTAKKLIVDPDSAAPDILKKMRNLTDSQKEQVLQFIKGTGEQYRDEVADNIQDIRQDTDTPCQTRNETRYGDSRKNPFGW